MQRHADIGVPHELHLGSVVHVVQRQIRGKSVAQRVQMKVHASLPCDVLEPCADKIGRVHPAVLVREDEIAFT